MPMNTDECAVIRQKSQAGHEFRHIYVLSLRWNGNQNSVFLIVNTVRDMKDGTFVKYPVGSERCLA